jgi:TonB family protein
MNRIQKKCFVFSVGLHGLLAVILLGSAAFRNDSEQTNAPILSLIPANILDQAGAGGGQPAPASPAAQAVMTPQPPAQPVATPPRTEAQPAPPRPVPRAEPQQPKANPEETRPVVAAETSATLPAKTHRQHEIHPTFTPVGKNSDFPKKENAQLSSKTLSSRSEARRLKDIENSLDHLASGVQTSGAGRTVVDVEGIGGGGEVFAGYSDVVRSVYYNAWIAPDGGASKTAAPEARIVVARDGSIISADLVGPSGESALDKSVVRVLGAVKKLPPFPASARDEQRTFRIQFSLDLKQATG